MPSHLPSILLEYCYTLSKSTHIHTIIYANNLLFYFIIHINSTNLILLPLIYKKCINLNTKNKNLKHFKYTLDFRVEKYFLWVGSESYFLNQK